MKRAAPILALGLLAAPVAAQETPATTETAEAPKASSAACEGVCVPSEDMEVFVAVLKEKKCLLKEQPEFQLDPITVVVDQDGRIYYSGADPKPYTLKMKWCNYEAEAQGKVNIVAAMTEPPIWGFRFRPKAYLGVLPLELLQSDKTARDMVDAGLMVDFFYYSVVNLNAAVGFRSVGAGVGVDITQNFGWYTGYAFIWDGFRQGVNGSFWFAF